MRKNIRIARHGNVVQVAFAYPDRAKAQGVTAALLNRMENSMTGGNSSRAALWRQAWPNDPPPPEQRLVLESPPDSPEQPAGRVRPAFLAAGTTSGLVLAWLLRRPKRNLRLAGFAAAGAAVAVALSFTVSERYTSSAVVRLAPPQAPKRLWNVVSPETPSDKVHRLQAQILRPDNLAGVAAKANLSARPEDLRIASAGTDAFLISFTYTDPYKAQVFVRELITQLVERNVEEARPASERMLAPNLEVLDPATLPEMPVFPNRLAIGAVGLPVGLLAGAFVLRRRRAAQPA